MAEYAGYVPTKPVDFGAISSDFLSKKIAVGQIGHGTQVFTERLLKMSGLDPSEAQLINIWVFVHLIMIAGLARLRWLFFAPI